MVKVYPAITEKRNHFRNGKQLHLTLNQMNSVYTIIFSFFHILILSLTFHYMPWFPKWFLPSWFSDKYFVRNSHLLLSTINFKHILKDQSYINKKSGKLNSELQCTSYAVAGPNVWRLIYRAIPLPLVSIGMTRGFSSKEYIVLWGCLKIFQRSTTSLDRRRKKMIVTNCHQPEAALGVRGA